MRLNDQHPNPDGGILTRNRRAIPVWCGKFTWLAATALFHVWSLKVAAIDPV
jgi:hypothetical protein